MNGKSDQLGDKNSLPNIQAEDCIKYQRVYAPEPLISEAHKLMEELKADQINRDTPSN